jgi:transcriptional regulator with GAF, ATPase, and Fis domain
MTKLDFTPAQLEFLAALDALQGPASIKIVGAIAPLSPSELLELLRRGKKLKLIYEPEQDIFGLSGNLPQYLLKKFQEINDKKKIDALFRRLLELNLWEEIPLPLRANMLARSGNEKDAALLFIEIADQSFENEKNAAYDNLLKAINILPPYLGKNETDILFVKACLQLCYLCYFFGRFLSFLPQLLKIAIKSAEQLGDKRSKALLNFHLGFFHFTFGSTSEALQNLEAGRLIFEELGDEDMLSQSAGFIGLYYFIQGLNREALEMFEKAELYFNSHTGFLYGPIFMAYSAAYSGHFDRAIGCLDYYWHLTQRMGREPFSASYRAALGIFLLATFKFDAAKLHLSSALESAYASNNEFAAFSAETGLAFYYYKSKNLNMAIKYLNLVYSRMMKSQITILSMEPWQIQMVYDAEKQGYKPPSEFSCHRLIERLMKEKNVHLKGISLRLKAKDLVDAGEPREQIIKLLYESESCLKAASDPIQLAKTQLEIARLELNEGHINEARLLAMKARLSLSGNWEDLFPDDLRFLLDKENHAGNMTHFGDSFIEEFIDMLGKLPYHHDIDRSISNILEFTNRVFRAERGAILWVDSIPKKTLKPKTLKNMSESDLYAESFRSNMAAIIKCQGENRPILVNNKSMNPKSSHLVPTSAICLPICINCVCHGVLYHDNTYLENSFELLSKKTLERVSVHLEQYFVRCFEFNKAIEKTKKIVAREAILTTTPNDKELVTSCQVMIDLLDQADKVATTESTVLVLGETGVGKELLAKRIHKMSLRSSAPFITVDSTTIADNLVESELFGHEKGAFTGADRQKIGRLELADKGTLFIDEIGELPKSTQAKLLRVLQEKTFIRVGGTLSISSDFRLIVATNRNLEDEVKKKNFREDLFYRLNTVPLTLPPLRERDNDIMELAKYFLKRFSLKYQRDNLAISPEEEKRLCLYHWPGNIRELEHVIERSVILSKGDQLELSIIAAPKPMLINETTELVTLDELQRRYILHVLEKTGGKIYGQGAAAEILGINRGTLYSRMKKLGIKGL